MFTRAMLRSTMGSISDLQHAVGRWIAFNAPDRP
jgi:hypothetical protein